MCLSGAKAHLAVQRRDRVGVPGCERPLGPSTHMTHFQAGQRRTCQYNGRVGVPGYEGTTALEAFPGGPKGAPARRRSEAPPGGA